jgi:hypothetical protein
MSGGEPRDLLLFYLLPLKREGTVPFLDGTGHSRTDETSKPSVCTCMPTPVCMGMPRL